MEKINHNNFPDGIELLITKIENLEFLILNNFKTQEPALNDRIDRIDDACQLINYSKSKVYKMTMNNKLPFLRTKTGRLIFSRKKLLEWQEENIMEEKKINNVMLNIAESARKK